MKIGVIGAGFVGSAVINALTCEYLVVDPDKTVTIIDELLEWEPDAVFVCVPTPSMPNGSVNPYIVLDVLAELPDELLIILKSTITPNYLINRSMRLVYNPEFLTQRTAQDDFLTPDSLILGGEPEDCKFVAEIYRDHTKVQPCKVFHTDLATAALIKYTLNCHFVAKVIFMNEIHQLHSKIAGSTWEEFTCILAGDSRLGPTHLMVPGPDGELGYGGACFPKDTKALINYADDHDVDLTVLKTAMNTNDRIR